MSISVLQHTTFHDPGGGAARTYNAGSNFTAGSKVFFLVSSWPDVHGGVTIGGVTATRDLAPDAGSGDDSYAIWYADGVAGGRSDIVTTGANASHVVGDILEVTGLATGGAHKTGTATGTSNAPAATSAATTIPDCLVLALFRNRTDGNGAATPGGWTYGYSANTEGSDEGGAGMHRIVSATGAQTITFAVTGGGSINWGCGIAAYAGTAAAAASTLDDAAPLPPKQHGGKKGNLAQEDAAPLMATAPYVSTSKVLSEEPATKSRRFIGAVQDAFVPLALAAIGLSSFSCVDPGGLPPRRAPAIRRAPAELDAPVLSTIRLSSAAFTDPSVAQKSRRSIGRVPAEDVGGGIDALAPRALGSFLDVDWSPQQFLRRQRMAFVDGGSGEAPAVGLASFLDTEPLLPRRVRRAVTGKTVIGGRAFAAGGFVDNETPVARWRRHAAPAPDPDVFSSLLRSPLAGDEGPARARSRRQPVFEEWLGLGTIQHPVATFLDADPVPARRRTPARSLDDQTPLGRFLAVFLDSDQNPAVRRGRLVPARPAGDDQVLEAMGSPALLAFFDAAPPAAGRGLRVASRLPAEDTQALDILSTPSLFAFFDAAPPVQGRSFRSAARSPALDTTALDALQAAALRSFLDSDPVNPRRRLTRAPAGQLEELSSARWVLPFLDTDPPVRGRVIRVRPQDDPLPGSFRLSVALDNDPAPRPRGFARWQPGDAAPIGTLTPVLRGFLGADDAPAARRRSISQLVDALPFDGLGLPPIGFDDAAPRGRIPRVAPAPNDGFPFGQAAPILGSFLADEPLPPTRARGYARVAADNDALDATVPAVLHAFFDAEELIRRPCRHYGFDAEAFVGVSAGGPITPIPGHHHILGGAPPTVFTLGGEVPRKFVIE